MDACCDEGMTLEWSGKQQAWFLLQSVGLGVLLGVSFDLLNGVCRAIRRRWVVVLLDALFGVFAALVTFFGALVMMDGQLHPLLFMGALFGFITEHSGIGTALSRFVCRLCRWIGGIGGAFCRLEELIAEKTARILARLWQCMQNKFIYFKKMQKNTDKF